MPYLNQFYLPGWQTRRNNTFGYLKADWSFSDVTSLSLGLGGYFHRNRGRGDWLPSYIADVTDDDGGPESELMGGTPRPGRFAARADPLRESRGRRRRADGRVHVPAIVANNLFDKAYLSAITENAAWLGAPRTISMTATVSF